MCTESSLFGSLGFGNDRIARCWEHAHGRHATSTAFGAGLADLIGDVRKSMSSVWATIECIREDEAYVRQRLLPALMDSGELFTEITEPGVMDSDRTLERLGPALRLAHDAEFKTFSRRTRQRRNVIFANTETLVRAYDTATRRVAGARNASGAVVPKSMADVRSDFDATFSFGSSSWLDDAVVAIFAVIEDNRVLIALGMFALVTAYCTVVSGKSAACDLMHRLYACTGQPRRQPQQQSFGSQRSPSVQKLLASATLRPMLEHCDRAHPTDPDVPKLMRRLVLASDGSERDGWVAAMHVAQLYVDSMEKRDDAQKRMLLAVRTESREHLESVLQRIGVLVDPGLDPSKRDDYAALCAAVDEPLRGLRVVLATLDAFYAGRSLEWTVGIGTTLAELSGRGTHAFGESGGFGARAYKWYLRHSGMDGAEQEAAAYQAPDGHTGSAGAGPPKVKAPVAAVGNAGVSTGAESALFGALGSVGDALFGENSWERLNSAEVNGAKYRAAVLGLALLMSIYIHPMMGIAVFACGSVAYLMYNYVEGISDKQNDDCYKNWNLFTCFFITTTNIQAQLGWAKYGLAVAGAVWVFNLLKPLIPMDDDEAAYADYATGMLSGAADTAATFHQQMIGARRKSNLVLGRVAAKAVGAGLTSVTGNTAGADLIRGGADLFMHDDQEEEEEEDQHAAPAQGQAQGRAQGRALRQGKARMLV